MKSMGDNMENINKIDKNKVITTSAKAIFFGGGVVVPIPAIIRKRLNLEPKEEGGSFFDPVVELQVRHTGEFIKRVKRKKKDNGQNGPVE